MTENRTGPQQTLSIHNNAAPQLYLSSAAVQWDGLLAQAFHEPMQLEGYMTEAMPDVALILFSGGAMRMDRRQDSASWQSQVMRQGDLILRPAGGTAQEVRWQGMTRAPMQTLHLHLSDELLSRTVEEVTNTDPTRLSLVGRAGFQDPLLMDIGFALWRELEQPSPIGKLYVQTAAQMLAVHLLSHYTAASGTVHEPSQELTPQQMKRVTDYINANLSVDLSLDNLAKQIGFSPYHFARLFRRTTGESPHRFVLRQRVEQARRLLQATDAPLTDIASETGFASQSHLSQVFKQQSGITPRAYRQIHRGRARF